MITEFKKEKKSEATICLHLQFFFVRTLQKIQVTIDLDNDNLKKRVFANVKYFGDERHNLKTLCSYIVTFEEQNFFFSYEYFRRYK